MPLVVSDNPAVPCPGDAVAVTVSGIACVTRTVFTGLFFSSEFPIRLLYNGGGSSQVLFICRLDYFCYVGYEDITIFMSSA